MRQHFPERYLLGGIVDLLPLADIHSVRKGTGSLGPNLGLHTLECLGVDVPDDDSCILKLSKLYKDKG